MIVPQFLLAASSNIFLFVPIKQKNEEQVDKTSFFFYIFDNQCEIVGCSILDLCPFFIF